MSVSRIDFHARAGTARMRAAAMGLHMGPCVGVGQRSPVLVTGGCVLGVAVAVAAVAK